MAIINIDLSDTVEPTVVEPDREYKVRIIGYTEGVDKNGLSYVQIKLDIPDEPTAKDFTKFLHLPAPGMMDPKKLNNTKFALQTFMKTFKLTMPLDLDEAIGSEGWAVLGVEDKGDEYGAKNYIKKFIPGA